MRRQVGLLAFLAVDLAGGALLLAHSFGFTNVTLVLRAEGRFEAEVSCDLDALALGVEQSADSAALADEIDAMPEPERDELVARLAELLKRRLRVRFDGEPAPFEVSLPDTGKPRPEGAVASALGLVARLSGTVPSGAREVSFFASRSFPPVKLEIVRDMGERLHIQILQRGAESTPAQIGQATTESRWATFRRFVALGFEHILPDGLDHVLFVLGLAVFSARLAPLLVQVTAFTLAHTLTLALSTYGVVSLSPRVVEPLIALSIAYVAIENLLATRLSPFRVLVVFAFGLLHGLGFAGALAQLGLPERDRVLALLAFNGGVEVGQLTVIALAFGAMALLTRRGLDRRLLVRWGSVAIAAVGLFWAIRRVAGV